MAQPTYHGNTEKTYSKQGGRPKVSIGRIRKYVVSTRLSPERKLAFSALCRGGRTTRHEVLRQLIDRGTVRARITREQLDFMAQLKASPESEPADPAGQRQKVCSGCQSTACGDRHGHRKTPETNRRWWVR